MGELWIADFSRFDLPDGQMPSGRGAHKARFLGRIVSAASLLAAGVFQASAITCRRRPRGNGCPGRLRVGRDAETDEIHWSCTHCSDRGVITNWRESRWDLTPELKQGRIVSLSEERARRTERWASSVPLRIYELEIDLVYAPVALGERVCRRLRLGGDSTLHALHRLILQAFDRDTDEAYEFMFGAPYDPQTRRFTGAGHEGDEDEGSLLETAHVRLDSLGLKPGDSFGYLFDFNDEWVHRVTVRAIKEVVGRGILPQVVSRLGDSPSQLPRAEERWEDDLFWEDMEAEYPLTGLYGPYQAEKGFNAEDWLALDELERHLLVIEAHSHSPAANHPLVDSMLLHAVVHVMAETELATLGKRKAKTRLAPYLAQLACRHSAIHSLGEELVRQLLDASRTNPPTATAAKTRRHKHRGKPHA